VEGVEHLQFGRFRIGCIHDEFAFLLGLGDVGAGLEPLHLFGIWAWRCVVRLR
jgi:hypothetical protein